MRFGKNRCFSSAWEAVISGDNFPFSIDKEFDSIQTSRVDVQEKFVRNQFRIDRNNRSNTT